MNKEEILINEIKKEITFLENCIAECSTGEWSTNLVDPMKKRVLVLKGIIYDYQNTGK